MLTSSHLALVVSRWQDAMTALEQPLNAADAQLGDGDTGGMLKRLIDALAAAPAEQDLGQQFISYGKAAMMATGSSLGNLVAAGLMAIGRSVKGRVQIPFTELGTMLAVARDAMLERGQTALGDKTAIDLVDAVARAIAGQVDLSAMAASAKAAADDTLERFRAQPIRTGRARMFGDRTIGLDDPGMLAFALLTKAVAGRE